MEQLTRENVMLVSLLWIALITSRIKKTIVNKAFSWHVLIMTKINLTTSPRGQPKPIIDNPVGGY